MCTAHQSTPLGLPRAGQRPATISETAFPEKPRKPPRPAAPYTGNAEPALEEMLADPIVRLVMARDKVSETTLRAVIADARARARDKAMSMLWKGPERPLWGLPRLAYRPGGPLDAPMPGPTPEMKTRRNLLSSSRILQTPETHKAG